MPMSINADNTFLYGGAGQYPPAKDRIPVSGDMPVSDSVCLGSSEEREIKRPLFTTAPAGATQTEKKNAAAPVEDSIVYPPRICGIGYDEEFLGEGALLPLPRITGPAKEHVLVCGEQKDVVQDYVHFSLVMYRDRKMPFFAASNIDGARVRKDLAKPQWKIVEQVGAEFQIGPEMYRENSLDKGHLVRRQDVIWGTEREARWANENTFYYPNITPQHKDFNKKIWHSLENWILDRAKSQGEKLTVFTGPVFRDDDVRYRGEQIPAEFWKVAVRRRKSDNKLVATAFIMSQKEFLNNIEGKGPKGERMKYQEESVDTSVVAPYHVSIHSIEELTSLKFGELMEVEPAQFFDEP
jgi:endonuclease G